MIRTAVLPGVGRARLQPLDGGLRVSGGFWGERIATNRERTIAHGLVQLEASGALHNFRNAGRRSGRYIGGLDDAGITFPFLDSDVYKWLEAVGWELGRADDANLREQADSVIVIVKAAQRADGYLGTFVQLSGREPYTDLQWGHELYCIGHLAQAAVAWKRALGDDRLLTVAGRAVDHIEAALGADGRPGIDGHPEIEMALVELYRVTGRERDLELARLQIERRGHGLLGGGRLGARYWQDHQPVREAPAVTGHAVRQLYLDCGAVDVAVETGDQDLLGAVLRRWSDMWATRTYLTGSIGSRHRDEAFGDPFELPSDRAYAETCAAIGSVMLAWRLLLATGEARFADAIERTLYNAVLPGLSLDGRHFFYSNPLQARAGAVASGVARARRAEWYPCACCPPNIMRMLSTFEQLVATRDQHGIQMHQFASGDLVTALAGDPIRLRIETDQPWGGAVRVTVEETPVRPWSLAIRLPTWLRGGLALVAGRERRLQADLDEMVVEQTWSPGDSLILELEMPARFTLPDERIDAIRGCAAIERGPLVYCLEQADLPAGSSLEDIEINLRRSTVPRPAHDPILPDSMVGIDVDAIVRSQPSDRDPTWPYRDHSATDSPASTTTRITAYPYLTWANRDPGPMRVWLPIAAERSSGAQDPGSDQT